MGAGRWDELAEVLGDLAFLECKAEAGMVFQPVEDFVVAVREMPADHPLRGTLRPLDM